MKEFLNVALPKGRLGERVYAMFAQAGFPCEELLDTKRKLIFENPEAGVRYFWVKPPDVPVYVERGAADVGVAGKDILLEYGPEVYELLDLNIGRCRMCVAAKNGGRPDGFCGWPRSFPTSPGPITPPEAGTSTSFGSTAPLKSRPFWT